MRRRPASVHCGGTRASRHRVRRPSSGSALRSAISPRNIRGLWRSALRADGDRLYRLWVRETEPSRRVLNAQRQWSLGKTRTFSLITFVREPAGMASQSNRRERASPELSRLGMDPRRDRRLAARPQPRCRSNQVRPACASPRRTVRQHACATRGTLRCTRRTGNSRRCWARRCPGASRALRDGQRARTCLRCGVLRRRLRLARKHQAAHSALQAGLVARAAAVVQLHRPAGDASSRRGDRTRRFS